jgi:alpha-glucosidase
VLAYERRQGAERLIVALNLGAQPQRLELPDWASNYRPLLSTLPAMARAANGALQLQPDEGAILAPE